MKILIVSTRELCYFSGSFFLDRIQGELERTGVEVVRLDFSGNEADFSELEQYIGKSFDAIIDMNSKLPYLIDEDGERILDKIHGPFINYIVDHPLYHHPGLSFPLKNYYVIGIDRAHCEYMRNHYSHLKGVKLLPMAGTRGVVQPPFEDRKEDILFMGTYLRDDELQQKIRGLSSQINPATYQLAMELSEDWMDDKTPIEEALYGLLLSSCGGKTKEDVEDYILDVYELSGFAELLNYLFLVDQRKRNEKRMEVLTTIAKTNTPVTVVGEGWEHTDLDKFKNVSLKPGCTMAHSFEIMANYKKILDINPLFYCGFHDRVMSAMANGCVCITDMSPRFDEELVNGENLFFYKRKQIKDVVADVNALPKEKLVQVAAGGFEYWKSHYTWEIHTKKLLEFIEEIS
ncbi:MAG: hypothetical protein K5675_01265 [Lachnospiraceae bacterium]|nr:hypothetical protein [Lachnospiraceae bacterium]